MPSPRFICFEGLDGAGKTSAAARLAEALDLAGERADFLERKDPCCDDERLRRRLELLAALIWDYGDAPIERMGDHSALYNVASWFSAIDLLRVRPALAAGRSVVIDNWYFKFLARMTLKERLDADHAARCFAHLSAPDHVILLNVSPEVAASRKTRFARGETGGFDGFGVPRRSSFVRYQTLVRTVLLEFADRQGWTVIDADDRSLEDVVRLSLETLLRDRRPRRDAPAASSPSGSTPHAIGAQRRDE